MGLIRDKANIVYGDGPTSAPSQPPKQGARELNGLIEDSITGAAAGMIRATSVAGLGSGTRVGQPGQVTQDPGSGEYYWSGSAWIRTGDIIDPEAIAEEKAAREAIIQASADGKSLVVVDGNGYVLARIDVDGLAFPGRSSFGEINDGVFKVKDGSGFLLLRADQDGLRVLGEDVPTRESLPQFDQEVRQDSIGYRWSAADLLPKWRKARSRVRLREGQARILCIGDSNTMGWDAAGAGVPSRLMSYPVGLAAAMSGLSASCSDGFGRALTSTTGYSAYDPRATIGAGWSAAGGASLGGEMWINSTDTSAIEFNPAEAWDTADVWVALDDAATLAIGISGDLHNFTPSTGSIVKLTYQAPSIALQALQIARVSGAIRVIGWSLSRSDVKGISIYNAGRSGWRSDQYDDATSYYSPRNAISAVAPDVGLIQLGLNDFNQARDPALFGASLLSIAGAVSSAGADPVIIISLSPDGIKLYPWRRYVDEMISVADQIGAPIVDLGARFGPYAQSTSQGFAASALHLNRYGYFDAAHIINNLLHL